MITVKNILLYLINLAQLISTSHNLRQHADMNDVTEVNGKT